VATIHKSDLDVYTLAADGDRYEYLVLATEEDISRSLEGFDGRPMAGHWVPLRVEFVRAPKLPGRSDFPSLEGISVFSARAVEALSDLLDGRCELLPLQCDDGEYFALNVTRLTDALDEERSQFKYFSDGEIMRVERFEFDPAKLARETIFKLPQTPETYEYVTGIFRRRVEEAGLTGFAFDRRVWTPAAAQAAS
jgi:hypothetical protein